MNRRAGLAAVAVVALAATAAAGGWASSADAATTQPVSGGGYYVAGAAASGSLRFVVPTPDCGLNETSTLYTGLQSAGVTGTSTTFASGVISTCVVGVPGTIAVQYSGGTPTAVQFVQPGDTVVITFDHAKGTETLTDVTSNLTGTVDIPDVSNQAGVFFGIQAVTRPPVLPLLDGGKVTLTVTVNGATLAAASPVKQLKRVGGTSLTPSVITKTGKAFTIKEVDHNTG